MSLQYFLIEINTTKYYQNYLAKTDSKIKKSRYGKIAYAWTRP